MFAYYLKTSQRAYESAKKAYDCYTGDAHSYHSRLRAQTLKNIKAGFNKAELYASEVISSRLEGVTDEAKGDAYAILGKIYKHWYEKLGQAITYFEAAAKLRAADSPEKQEVAELKEMISNARVTRANVLPNIPGQCG